MVRDNSWIIAAAAFAFGVIAWGCDQGSSGD